MFDPDLPSNRLIYEIRKRPDLFRQFAQNLEILATEYRLSEEETSAWRNVDIRRLSELGVHPYFLPQVSRLMMGSGNNDSKSDAAQAYRKSMVERSTGAAES